MAELSKTSGTISDWVQHRISEIKEKGIDLPIVSGVQEAPPCS